MCLQVLSELSASFASLVDIIELSANVTYNSGGAERVHTLSKQWAESMTHVFERKRYMCSSCDAMWGQTHARRFIFNKM